MTAQQQACWIPTFDHFLTLESSFDEDVKKIFSFSIDHAVRVAGGCAIRTGH